MRHTFHGMEAFAGATGLIFEPSDWYLISQERIDAFADVSEDWQWIHVDVERARATGGTIAHGYLTLSLIPRLSAELFDFAGIGRAINYGLDRVRFPTPVHAGDRVRVRAQIADVTRPASGGALGRVSYVIEVEGSARPACVAEALMLVLPGSEDGLESLELNSTQ